jgi:hypothetical protein
MSKLSFIPSAFYDKRMQMRGKTKGGKIHDKRLYVIRSLSVANFSKLTSCKEMMRSEKIDTTNI